MEAEAVGVMRGGGVGGEGGVGGRGRRGFGHALEGCNFLSTALSGGSRNRVEWGCGRWGRRGFGHALEACKNFLYLQQ